MNATDRVYKFSQQTVVYDLLKRERERIAKLDDYYRAMETLKIPLTDQNFSLQLDCQITLPMCLTKEEQDKVVPLISDAYYKLLHDITAVIHYEQVKKASS